MIINNINQAIFLQRINRFVGKGLLNGREIKFHIADTGRLEEYFVKGNKILLQSVGQGHYKYNYRLIAGYNPILNDWTLLNSILHLKLLKEYLDTKNIYYRTEPSFRLPNGEGLRLDLYINRETFVEVKGCSLVGNINNIKNKKLFLVNEKFKNYVGLFPDAVTKRGKKHINFLIDLLSRGLKAEVWFLMLNKVKYFYLNYKKDPEFETVLLRFLEKGGNIKFLFVNLKYIDNYIKINILDN